MFSSPRTQGQVLCDRPSVGGGIDGPNNSPELQGLGRHESRRWSQMPPPLFTGSKALGSHIAFVFLFSNLNSEDNTCLRGLP